MIQDILNQPTFTHRVAAFIDLGKTLGEINVAIIGYQNIIDTLSRPGLRWVGRLQIVGSTLTLELPYCVGQEELLQFVIDRCRSEISRLNQQRQDLCRLDTNDKTADGA